jgi:hypothetical protein
MKRCVVYMPRKNVKNAGTICLYNEQSLFRGCRNYLSVKKLYNEQSVFRGSTGVHPPPPPVFSYKEKTCGGGRFNFVRRKGIRMKHFIKKYGIQLSERLINVR